MKKIIKRTLATTSLLGLVIVSGLISLVLFPEPLFANKLEYANFRIYSNEAIHPEIKTIFNCAAKLVEKSEIYDPSYTYDVFIAWNTPYNKINDIIGKGVAARSTGNNIVIKVPINIITNSAINKRSRNINLTELMAHEMIHCLQLKRLGLLKMNPLNHPEFWKMEGYPEYISRQSMLNNPSYNLVSEIKRYLKLKNTSTDGWVEVTEGNFIPDIYLKGRLMTEYLINVKNFTYHKIISDTRSEETIFSEMIDWHINQNSSK